MVVFLIYVSQKTSYFHQERLKHMGLWYTVYITGQTSGCRVGFYEIP